MKPSKSDGVGMKNKLTVLSMDLICPFCDRTLEEVYISEDNKQVYECMPCNYVLERGE